MESKLLKGLNEQYNFEIESGYIYISMAHHVKEKGMDGFAHFFYKQAQEEFEHAEKLRNFLFEIDEKPVLEGIKKPQEDFGNFTDTFKTALEHEKEVTKRIENIYELALKEKNYVVVEFLNWFLKEQVEEEDNMRTIVEVLENLKDGYTGLYLYDKELGRRE